MAEIVRKIGKITRYETKIYVGRARILDLDRSAPGVARRRSTATSRRGGSIVDAQEGPRQGREGRARGRARRARERRRAPRPARGARDLGPARPRCLGLARPAARRHRRLAASTRGERAVVRPWSTPWRPSCPTTPWARASCPEPGAASHGQVVERRLPAGAIESPPGVDPTRVFPGLAHEHVAAVPGSTTGSTLHVASDVDAVDGDDSAAAKLLDRAATALGHALHLSRQLASRGPGPRDAQRLRGADDPGRQAGHLRPDRRRHRPRAQQPPHLDCRLLRLPHPQGRRGAGIAGAAGRGRRRAAAPDQRVGQPDAPLHARLRDVRAALERRRRARRPARGGRPGGGLLRARAGGGGVRGRAALRRPTS